MDQETERDDSGGQRDGEENEYKDNEDTRNKTASDNKVEENSKSKNKDKEDTESEKENENKVEEDTPNKNEREESESHKEKGELKAESKSNEQVREKEPSQGKRKLSFMSLFTKKSSDVDIRESESQESEDEIKTEESSERAKEKSSSRKKKKSSLLSLFSLKPDTIESKESGSQEERDDSEAELRSDELAERKRELRDTEKEEEEGIPIRPRRPSLIKKKFLALEMELNVENVYKKVTNIFSPNQDKPSEEETKVSIDEPRRAYLSSAMAAMFIVSSSTGGAISGLAFFLMQSSWFGVFLILLLGFNAIYSGLCTGWSWTIMEKIWPEYLEYSRIPYQDIAYRAVGSWMRYIVAFFVDITLLVSSACYIVFMADSIARAVENDHIICVTIIIIILLLLPFSFFGSFSNMKFIGLTDVLASISYTLLIIISIFIDKTSRGPVVYSDPSPSSIVIAFAGMSFAYGIGAIMPSIMVEMADKSMFTSTCVTAYMVIVAMYVVFPILGYAAYGDETPTAILHHIYSNKKLHYFAVFIDCINVVQLGTTFICAMMPTMHAFEERLRCPERFCTVRVGIRLTMLLFMLLLVLGVPYIPRFMVFIGATSMNILTFILPPIFYVCLVYKKESKSNRSEMSKRAWILIVEIVLLGLVVGAISMYVSVTHYVNSPIEPRNCFANMSASLPTEGERIS